MKIENPMIVGRVVRSKAGRDKGKFFVVVDLIDDNYVYLADGVLRKLSAPKKKKIKHLEAKSDCITSIREKLMNEKKVFDSEVRAALDGLGYLKK